MEKSLPVISAQICETLYLKDPESSELGRKMVAGGIILIENVGFESFTFRKLAKSIQSTEASIYRYFESKHKFLLYLLSWYWGWIEYCMIRETESIHDPKDKLKKIVQLLTDSVKEDTNFLHVDEVKLHSIVVSESAKVFLTKDVDQERQDGFFKGYESIVKMTSGVILEINPEYRFPKMIVSTIIEGAHNQYFFSQHIPHLTNVGSSENFVRKFFEDLVFKAIG